MRALLRQVVHTLEKGQDVELVTVLASGGSTPRGAGAVLAVFPDQISRPDRMRERKETARNDFDLL